MDIKDVISKMSIQEKISLLSGKDFWQTNNIDKYGIKSMFLSDGPSGVRKQAASADHLGLNESLHAVCFPSSGALANTWNVDLIHEVGKALGSEAKSQNVNILLAPGMNIKRNPMCGRNFEYYSEDPYLAGKMAAHLIKGVQENNISACVKHFACNNQELQRQVVDTILDEKTLREIYLTGFEIVCKEAKPLTLMTSYNLVNSQYANENKHLLRDILRDEWNYKGLIVTDWGGDNDRVKALKCGSDLEMPGSNGATYKDVLNAYNNHEIDEALINESVERILNTHELTKEAFEKQDKFNPSNALNVARKAAAESIVLLKNTNNVLPLNKSSKVCLIGDFGKHPRYQGAGSSMVNPHKVVSLYDAISSDKEISFIGYEQGYKRFGKDSKSLLKKAIKLANQADVIVLCLGLDEYSECEGIDRKHINIGANQIKTLQELKKLGKPIIGILFAGSVTDTSYDANLDGFILASLLGEQGGNAILDILKGDVNPSGKLAETYAYKYDDYSTSNNFPGTNREIIYYEGPWVGYRYFNKINLPIKYCFGYGLSYSKFEYSNLLVNKDSVSFDIKNIGDYKGQETAMLFIGKKDSKYLRPIKELKGFAKVNLNKGESKNVTIKFDEYSFRSFDMKQNKWVNEAGEYQLYIASNVNDVRLTGSINIEGEVINDSGDFEFFKPIVNGEVKSLTNEDKSSFEKKVNYVRKERPKKLIADYNTTVLELRKAKGWFGRAFAGVIVFAHNLLNFFGNKMAANSLEMGMYHTPLRNIARMSNGMICWESLDGMIMMFNGHFHKGFHKFFKGKRNYKKELKLAKKGAK